MSAAVSTTEILTNVQRTVLMFAAPARTRAAVTKHSAGPLRQKAENSFTNRPPEYSQAVHSSSDAKCIKDKALHIVLVYDLIKADSFRSERCERLRNREL